MEGGGDISLLCSVRPRLLSTEYIEGLSPKSVALSLGDPLVVDEINEALIYMSNGKAMRPGELPAELVKLGLSDSSDGILHAFHGIIVVVWMTMGVPQEWKHATKVLHKKECN